MKKAKYLKLGKGHKYNAKPVWACSECYAAVLGRDDQCRAHPDVKLTYFPSSGEFSHWHQLLLLQRVGQISDLKRQIPFKIVINDIKVTTYTADFSYIQDGEYTVIDFKGKDTDASKLRRKLTLAVHGIDVKLVKK
jgi:hypothetical protein